MPEIEKFSDLPGKKLEPPPAAPRLAPGLMDGGVNPPPVILNPDDPPPIVPPEPPEGTFEPPPVSEVKLGLEVTAQPDPLAPRQQSPFDMIPR